MSSTFEDSIFNFDFNLLKQSSKNVGVECKIEKLRKDIHLAKKKTIATDSLIKKYFSKSELLDQTEKLLVTAKEECKQVCIDYNTTLEKCTKREKDAQSLSLQNKELQERLVFSDNQCKAIQSHANQLQMLIRQYEAQIESLKVENQFEKNNKKGQTKPKEAQINEYDNLLNDVCLLRDIVLGKKKFHKHHRKILKKYEKFKPKVDVDVDDGSTSETSVEEMDIFHFPSPLSDAICDNNTVKVKVLSQSSLPKNMHKDINNDCLVDTKIDDDHDSDSGNEVISEDTGCGSSLGCSDMEKCFNSPEYFITDSPFSTVTQKEKKNFAEIATSPITVSEIRIEVATSPIVFDNYVSNHEILSDVKFTQDVGVTADPSEFIITKNIGTSTVTKFLLHKATSPVHFKPIVNTLDSHICKNVQDKATSPVQFDHIMNTTEINILGKKQDIATSPVNFNKCIKTTGTNTIRNNQCNVAISPIHFDSVKSTFEDLPNERECLEINNSIILNDSHNDCEIETILNTMRLDHELITPIPRSPAKPRNHQSQENGQNSHIFVCKDAAKVAAENDVLKVNIADLTKEILNIKGLLKFLSGLDNSDQVCNNTIRHSTVPMNTSSENVSSSAHKEKSATLDTTTNITQSTPEFLNTLYIDKPQSNVENVDQIQSRNEQYDKDLLKTSVNTLEISKKAIKLTKLDKLRRKLIPKCRIRRARTPIRKVKRRKQFIFKKKVLDQYPKSLQDNKLAYENAVKVMAEIREKEKNKPEKKPVVCNKYNDCGQELKVVLSKCDKIVQDLKNHSGPLTTQTKSIILNNLGAQNNATANNNVTPIKIGTVPSLNEGTPSLFNRESSITTRSHSKRLSSELSTNSDSTFLNRSDALFEQEENESRTMQVTPCRKRLKPLVYDNLESKTKRLLRSSAVPQISNIDDNAVNDEIKSFTFHQNSPTVNNKRRTSQLSTSQKDEVTAVTNSEVPKVIVAYNDLDIFSDKGLLEGRKNTSSVGKEKVQHPKESILCRMLEKYGKCRVRSQAKKLPEANINLISKQLEEGIAHILTIPQTETKQAMNDFVYKIQNNKKRYLLAGFMKYLKDPARKDELYKKVNVTPAPPMTKSEQVLLYIMKQLQASWTSGDFIESILSNIEFVLFQLNHTPDFGTVESLSHFYAVVCRYLGAKSRLRLFILDAMYCIQFKSVALIKQCLEVWMHVLPLAHMGIAKSPLVTCLVYLLHFFKCDDRFNRVQEIRDILSRKYSYEVTEWTESNVLEMFKSAIDEIREIPIEKKMLRMSLIILAKRRGPQWTQKNIVKKILLPFIEKEDTREKVKEFCILVLGPLLKPYPNDMKVYCEVVVNQLLEMLDSNITPLMKEAIISSLIFMKRHNQNRVIQALLMWNPEKISAELELLLKDYVREKPVKVWKTTLSRISVI